MSRPPTYKSNKNSKILSIQIYYMWMSRWWQNGNIGRTIHLTWTLCYSFVFYKCSGWVQTGVKLSHYNKCLHLIYFPTGTVAEGAPIIPISAQLKYNIEVVCEYIVNKIPVPVRDFTSEPRLIGKRFSILLKRTRCALWQSLDEWLFFFPHSNQVIWCQQAWLWSRWSERWCSWRKYPQRSPEGNFWLVWSNLYQAFFHHHTVTKALSLSDYQASALLLLFLFLFSCCSSAFILVQGWTGDWGQTRYRF